MGNLSRWFWCALAPREVGIAEGAARCRAKTTWAAPSGWRDSTELRTGCPRRRGPRALFLAEDEHGLLAARVHEKLHVPRRGVVASRVHEVLGDRDEPQVDVGGEHALRVVLHLGDDLPRGADDPREPVTVGHRLALRVGAAELLLHLRRPDLAGAQGERPRRPHDHLV